MFSPSIWFAYSAKSLPNNRGHHGVQGFIGFTLPSRNFVVWSRVVCGVNIAHYTAAVQPPPCLEVMEELEENNPPVRLYHLLLRRETLAYFDVLHTRVSGGLEPRICSLTCNWARLSPSQGVIEVWCRLGLRAAQRPQVVPS